MNVHATLGAAILSFLWVTAWPVPAHAACLWVEGEKPTQADVHRHPWWYDKVKKDELSGGDFISNWDDEKPGLLTYAVKAPQGGDYEFWVRANPVGTKLSFKVNDGPWTSIDMGKAQESVNIAGDGKIDLRFIAWIRADQVRLKAGENTIRFRMDSDNHRHGMLDCFVLSTEPFQPHGILKPGESRAGATSDADAGWFAFAPGNDPLKADCAIDLRSLNETIAGQGGFIAVKDGQFVHGRTGGPVRFWGVNGPPDKMGPAELRRCARVLAKYGVNLVRIHAPYYDAQGNIDPARVQHAIDVVEAMAAEGIYTDFSIFWYGFFSPAPNLPWLPGYNGKQPAVAALYFNPDFQKKYFSWWQALLTTPGQHSGKRLIDNPAVASLEFCNEDSYFFWTFSDSNIPDPEMRIVETQFGSWLKHKYGSLDEAIKHWNGVGTKRDNPAEGRMGFRPMWNLFHDRTTRDKDTCAFLVESQRSFYQHAEQTLRAMGFRGVMTGSNWTTANPQYLGPLDKYTYTACDYVDRHGYFGCDRKGPNEGWAIMNGQTYADRSALRFDPEKPGSAKDFNNPVIDVHYDGLPSAISETAFERPNRYRSEAPLYYACYGALQDSNAIDHFALDSDHWSTKPGYFMQPWTLMSPDMVGQFPAAALIYRKGLVSAGDDLVQLNLKIADLENLAGTPMPQDASFDVLRAKDVPQGTQLKPGNVIDPLVHFAGRTSVRFTAEGGPPKLADLSHLVDRAHSTVTSSTGQLKLDYEKGALTINAPEAQGVSGNLKDAGTIDLKDLSIQCGLSLGHIVAVSFDGKPLATSGKVLLQVMSEDKPSGWQTEPVGDGTQRVTNIGHDPWLVKEIAGTVKFKRADAGKLKVTALDLNGYPLKQIGTANAITLRADRIYYLIMR
jgi:hypothetical protein